MAARNSSKMSRQEAGRKGAEARWGQQASNRNEGRSTGAAYERQQRNGRSDSESRWGSRESDRNEESGCYCTECGGLRSGRSGWNERSTRDYEIRNRNRSNAFGGREGGNEMNYGTRRGQEQETGRRNREGYFGGEQRGNYEQRQRTGQAGMENWGAEYQDFTVEGSGDADESYFGGRGNTRSRFERSGRNLQGGQRRGFEEEDSDVEEGFSFEEEDYSDERYNPGASFQRTGRSMGEERWGSRRDENDDESNEENYRSNQNRTGQGQRRSEGSPSRSGSYQETGRKGNRTSRR